MADVDRHPTYPETMQMVKYMEDLLADAARERPHRQQFVPDPLEGHESPEWVIFERQTMLTALTYSLC
jgi:hypothetical protein